MGIKFHCPNGHKLNVKAFLAGKRGVCPKCGARMRIPTNSDASLVDSDLEETDASQHPSKSNGAGRVAAPAVSAAPAAAGAVPVTGDDDPIAQAPSAIWYVRPPTGGQYGPARGDVMRRWLTEGRVSSDSLVWREGWTDWQTAGKLFPTLNAAGTVAAPAAPVSEPSTTVPIATRSSRRTATRYEDKKRDSSSLAIAILVSLGILCAILIGVLVYVLMTLK
jgi:hypothetical protein